MDSNTGVEDTGGKNLKSLYKRTVMDSKKLLEVTGRDTRPEIELGKDKLFNCRPFHLMARRPQPPRPPLVKQSCR